MSRQRPRYRGLALAREISKCFNLFEVPRLLIVRLANRDARDLRTSEVMPGETDGRREELGARREGVKRLVPLLLMRVYVFASLRALTHVQSYTRINTRVQITNTRSCLSCELVGGATHPELNQRNVLSEALTRRPRSSAATDAPTCVRTPGPYFNHKLMFCLLRMHNCARESRYPAPSSSFLPSSALRFSCLHRPDRPMTSSPPPL